MLKVYTFELGPLGTNAFLLVSAERREAVLIDAPQGAWAAVEQVLGDQGVSLQALILTHGHWDHLQDAGRFHQAGIPVWAHAADREWIEHPEMMQGFAGPGIHLEPAPVAHELVHGEQLDFLGEEFEVRHVPGHSPGNILLYSPALEGAFVGDVIFCGSVGRFDLPGGDGAVLERSIRQQVYTLPDTTRLYCGHGPTTTVAQEKRSNPFVRG